MPDDRIEIQELLSANPAWRLQVLRFTATHWQLEIRVSEPGRTLDGHERMIRFVQAYYFHGYLNTPRTPLRLETVAGRDREEVQLVGEDGRVVIRAFNASIVDDKRAARKRND